VYAIILAGSAREANTYAKAVGLPRGRFRYATQASSIRGLRVATVHELPGFTKRPDKFSLESVLRYATYERTVVSPETFADLKRGLHQRETAYDVDRAAMVAHRYEAIKEASRGEETGAPKPSEAPAPAPKPRRAAAPKAPKPAPAAVAPTDYFA